MHKDLTLVILAAGMGSRYGGLKQIDKFGLNGEAIIDFSIYDAIEAGFNKLVLIIREEHQDIFEEVLVGPIRQYIDVAYAFQNVNDIPKGYSVPEGREKPWGTTHALLSAKKHVDTPFMICNADDYYGKQAFKVMAEFLSDVKPGEGAMVGYYLDNTLTDHGTVTRGVCERVDGYLSNIVEMDGIKRTDIGVVNGDDAVLAENALASMNFWGFTTDIFEMMEAQFINFLDHNVKDNPSKSEALLPNDVGELIDKGLLKVRVLETPDAWFGVTYQDDKPRVLEAFKNLQTDGSYPEKLWNK